MKAWDLAEGPYPMFKKPDINLEWRTEYTDACGGQQKYGGWSSAGRVKFVKLVKIVLASRKQNSNRHLQIEQDCIKRLQLKYQHLYKNKKTPSSKKRKVDTLTEEDEELLRSFIVDEEDEKEENGDEDEDCD